MFDIAQPQVKSIENSTSYGKFEIEPLEPGSARLWATRSVASCCRR